jgi:hypothetical protein
MHAELVSRARSWLRRQGCGIVLAEFRALTPEQPDALGWRDGLSMLVECKASRSDFLADRGKPFRADPSLGMGDWRFYLSPPGIVRSEDLPEGWGLLWAHPKKIERVHGGPAGNACYYRDRPFHGNRDAECRLLVSAMRRLQLHHGAAFDDLVHATYESKKPKTAATEPDFSEWRLAP